MEEWTLEKCRVGMELEDLEHHQILKQQQMVVVWTLNILQMDGMGMDCILLEEQLTVFQVIVFKLEKKVKML